ncbi:uncharacterized protein VICG_01469 [Vittaforma corneae ATCC 50505]|uniref:60S ribosomal protein L36 n=1 Tax=Vittaforma corneae (strain ATCC 50505) TaxID=993615 RepID=L2GLV4_VITCO|nr:uncharacterized protein VICG_01469 [Vittaforma corneae ATCC 50505]ELA41485.1 hypothetical protein VICG_01469 [Vittaforma corneae ATCC 50505]
MEMKRFYRKRRVAHKVTPINPEPVVKRKSFAISESKILARKIAQEVCGLMPYEKKAIDYIKKDDPKKAKKFLKARLGSMSRAEKKFETLMRQPK